MEEWFLLYSKQCKVPILLGYVDASKKEAGFADFYTPSGDFDKDMAEIRAFYANKTGLIAKNS